MIPTALTQKEADVLTYLAQDRRVLEVGALLGYSTVVLAKSAKVVHSVDPHEGYPEDDPRPTLRPFLRNLENCGVREKVVVHIGRDYQVLPVLEKGQFDMVFLDLTGRYRDTFRAMVSSIPLLKHHGVLAVHDCGHPKWPGVQKAVKHLARDRGTTYRMVDTTAIFEQTWGHRGTYV